MFADAVALAFELEPIVVVVMIEVDGTHTWCLALKVLAESHNSLAAVVDVDFVDVVGFDDVVEPVGFVDAVI